MTKESNLQSKIKKYLKSKGCFVIVLTVVPGVPDGTPDIVFFIEGAYGFIEVKKECPYKKNGQAKEGVFQPLQEKRLALFDNWSWGRVVWPENWLEIREELEYFIG